MIDHDPSSPEADGVSAVEALLELPRSAGSDALADFLCTVADTVRRTAGFTTVVLNVFRPAWDDYEAVLAIGPETVAEALVGKTIPRAAFSRIFAEANQPLPCLFFLEEGSELWADLPHSHVPPPGPGAMADAWRAGDGLLAFLHDSEGGALGFISMDEPASGRRPTPDELRLVHAISAHTAQALEAARRREAAAEHAHILSMLLETSPGLTSAADPAELFSRAGRTAIPALGFERYAAYVRDGERLRLAATRGWPDGDEGAPVFVPGELRAATVDALLAPVHEQAGCFLGGAAELFPSVPVPPGGRSARNGHGIAAWHEHCLVVPCRDGAGALCGLVVLEDPVDRRLPSLNRRRAVRLLVDQVAGALSVLRASAGASPSPRGDAPPPTLLGRLPRRRTPSRRIGDEIVAAQRETALLVCDLESLGEAGRVAAEEILARFGEMLRELARASDVPIRLAGEEFCVVLPGTDRDGAARAAARLRAATDEQLAALEPGLSISIGVAGAAAGVLDVPALIAEAGRIPDPPT